MLQFFGTSDKSSFILFVEFISVQKPKPRIRHKVLFPTDGETDSALLNTLQQFCFPFASQKDNDKIDHSEYVFYLAARDGGNPTYGYVLKENHKGPSSLTYCIISQYFAPMEMFKLMSDYLTAVASNTLYGDFFYDRLTPPVAPERVAALKAAEIEWHIAEALKTMNPYTLAVMIHAIVTDKRLIIIDKSLQTLTQCELALLCLIHPLSIGMFTPVLPPAMIDALGSPFPYVVGLQSSLKKTYAAMETEPHLLVNLGSRAAKLERLGQPPEQVRSLFKAFEQNVKKAKRDPKEIKRFAMNLVLEIIGLGLGCDPYNPSEMYATFERKKEETDGMGMATDPMLNDIIGSMVVLNLLEAVKPGSEMLSAFWPGKGFTRPRTRTVPAVTRPPLVPGQTSPRAERRITPKVMVDPEASQVSEIMRLAALFGQRQTSIDEEVRRSKQMMQRQQIEDPEKLSFRSKLRIYNQEG